MYVSQDYAWVVAYDPEDAMLAYLNSGRTTPCALDPYTFDQNSPATKIKM